MVAQKEIIYVFQGLEYRVTGFSRSGAQDYVPPNESSAILLTTTTTHYERHHCCDDEPGL